MTPVLTLPSPSVEPAPLADAPLELRQYQRDAAEAFRGRSRRGLRRMLVQMATGLGKTILFSHLAHEAVALGGRVLVIAHREELLDQAKDKLLMADPSANVGIVQAHRDECDAAIVVGSVQTLARPNRLARLTDAGRFSLVAVDEAHHAAAPSYRQVLDELGAFAPVGPLVLGVTATPARGDGVGLDSVFQQIVFSMGLLEGINSRYLCDVRAVSVTLDTTFDDVHARHGDLVDGELGAALLAANAPEHIVAAYAEHAAGRQTIAFAPTVAVARETAAAFQRAGVPAAWVSGETPRDERAATLKALQNGTLRVVANCGVLLEGFDAPTVSCIIVGRPTKSASLFQQMIGRGTRPHPTKRDCLVMDVIGQAGRHDLVSTASLFGLSPEMLARRTVTEAIEARQEAVDAALRRERPDARLVARPVNLFKDRAVHWVEASPDRFVLSIADGRITLEQRGHGWTATLARYGKAPAVLGRDLPLSYAQGVAEDRARDMGAAHLVDPNAPWRQKPASERQLAVLYRRGVRVTAGLTSGEASDLIAAGRRGA